MKHRTFTGKDNLTLQTDGSTLPLESITVAEFEPGDPGVLGTGNNMRMTVRGDGLAADRRLQPPPTDAVLKSGVVFDASICDGGETVVRMRNACVTAFRHGNSDEADIEPDYVEFGSTPLSDTLDTIFSRNFEIEMENITKLY